MTPLFYAHLVPVDDTLEKLVTFQLSDIERDTLENKILSIYHHRILDTILAHTPIEHHDILVQHISQDPTNLEIMIFVKSLNPEIEDHIIDAGKLLSTELHALLYKEMLFDINEKENK